MRYSIRVPADPRTRVPTDVPTGTDGLLACEARAPADVATATRSPQLGHSSEAEARCGDSKPMLVGMEKHEGIAHCDDRVICTVS